MSNDPHNGLAGMRVTVKELEQIYNRLRWAKIRCVITRLPQDYLDAGYIYSFYAKGVSGGERYLLIVRGG